MDWLARYLFALVGTPYEFGGKAAVGGGIDCSGFACEALIGAGALPHGTELNAQGMFSRFEHSGFPSAARLGDLCFYGKNALSITHVGIALDNRLMVEAGGGDAGTDTVAEARARKAMVRMRPILYRKDFLTIRRPGYPGYMP